MVRAPFTAALREPVYLLKPRPTILKHTEKISSPLTTTQCYHATSLARRSASTAAPRPSFLVRKQFTTPAFVSRRPESTITSGTTSATSTTPSPESTSLPTLPMTWDRFLHLRAIRRRFNLAASISTSLITTVAGISVLSQQDIDKIGNLFFGIDPVIAMGLSTVSCGAVGWLLGPFAGNAAFGLWYRQLRTQFVLVCGQELVQ
jgi:import inner membrane translocase subunit TIM23